jgi:hypothetical protein
MRRKYIIQVPRVPFFDFADWSSTKCGKSILLCRHYLRAFFMDSEIERQRQRANVINVLPKQQLYSVGFFPPENDPDFEPFSDEEHCGYLVPVVNLELGL